MAEPADTPVMFPVAGTAVAINVLPLLQVPPVVMLLSTPVAPTHMCGTPVIPNGSGFIVTVADTTQPPRIYDTVAVPGLTLLTSPELVMVATDNGVMTHEPVEAVSVNNDVAPMHMLILPPMAAGPGLTVTTFVMVQPEPSE